MNPLHRCLHLQQGLVAAVVFAAAIGTLAAQMPDSPTGRMAGALAELAGAEDDAAIESFLTERVAPSAARDSVAEALRALRNECRGAEIQGAEKSGPTSAKIQLVAGGSTCSVDYEVEASAPHRLTDIGLQLAVRRGGPGGDSPSQMRHGGPGEGGHDALARGFAAAFNSGDFETMQKFYVGNATEEFRSRRTKEEDRELYEMLYGDMGKLQIQSLDIEGPGRMLLGARAADMSDPVTFDFELQNGKIQGFRVNVGGPPQGDSAMALDLPEGADEKTVSAALDRELGKLTDDDEFSGVVFVGRAGKPIFHRAYGMANRESGRANATNTRFDVGSITKLLTKIAVAQLAEAGKLSLDDTLADVLPSYPNQEIARRITLRQLLKHRSGLGDIFNDRWDDYPKDKLVSPSDFFPLFSDLPLNFEPDQSQSYSNAGYIVLGAVVEAVSGKPYAEYLDTHVFRPAGMRRSGFPVRDGTSADLAVGYTREGAADDGLHPNLGMLPIRGCPAGSSSHTAEDLWKFDLALRGDKLLGPGWTDWVFTGKQPSGKTESRDNPPSFAMGVAGGGPGVNAVLESDPELTVIVLSNLDPPTASRLGRQLKRAFAGGS